MFQVDEFMEAAPVEECMVGSMSIREASRAVGLHQDTVRRMLECPDIAGPSHRGGPRSALLWCHRLYPQRRSEPFEKAAIHRKAHPPSTVRRVQLWLWLQTQHGAQAKLNASLEVLVATHRPSVCDSIDSDACRHTMGSDTDHKTVGIHVPVRCEEAVGKHSRGARSR